MNTDQVSWQHVIDEEIGAWRERAEKAEARIDLLQAERNLTLKAVLFHFGPEGANKVTNSVLEARAEPSN